MDTRINILQTYPEAYKAMMGLEKFIETTSLDATHKELIKIRASQINGCAFCIDMHTKDARKMGFSEQKIYLLNAWNEVNLFSEEEKAILAITEEVTLISKNHLTEKTYQNAKQYFDEKYIAAIILMTTIINAWNRVAIASELQPAS